MDNEEDCGHVIRVGNSGRHRDNDDVRDNLHQDPENAGGDHMADTASLKEILFRHSAEQCKVCEAIPFTPMRIAQSFILITVVTGTPPTYCEVCSTGSLIHFPHIGQ